MFELLDKNHGYFVSCYEKKYFKMNNENIGNHFLVMTYIFLNELQVLLFKL